MPSLTLNVVFTFRPVAAYLGGKAFQIFAETP